MVTGEASGKLPPDDKEEFNNGEKSLGDLPYYLSKENIPSYVKCMLRKETA